jgi:hypothetical protein|tara:strand:- start:208 stop:666 length:459 start_codon:yes stop_codon:yes gene_type:complete
MNDLFFNLSHNVTKLKIVSEINKHEMLDKANVAYLGTSSDILENGFLDLSNGSSKLIALFDDSDKKVSGFKILMRKQIDELNANTIVNLLRSTDVKYEFGKNETTKDDQYLFWKGDNRYAFCSIEIQKTEGNRTLSGNAEYQILIEYYFNNI